MTDFVGASSLSFNDFKSLSFTSFTLSYFLSLTFEDPRDDYGIGDLFNNDVLSGQYSGNH